VNYVVAKAVVLCGMAPLWSDGVRAHVARRLQGASPVRLWPWFAAWRLALVVLAFGVLRLKLPGDAAGYYATYARDAFGAGRSAASAYNPGFDYLLGLLLRLFGSPLSFVVVFVLAEVAAFWLFCRTTPDAPDRNDPLLRDVAVLWLLNPLSIAFIPLGAQDEALILLSWCAVWWAIGRNRDRTAGVLAATGFFCTKILGVVALLPAIDSRSVPRRAAAAFAGCVAVVVAVCVVLRIPLLGFLQESRLVTSGNLWTVLTMAIGDGGRPSAVWQFSIAAACMVAGWWQVRSSPLDSRWQQLLRSTGIVGALFLLASPKAWTHYAIMFLPGLLFLVVTLPRRLRWLLLFAFLPVSAFEPSLWFYFDAGAAFAASPTSRLLMLGVDGIVIGGYAVLVWHALRLRPQTVVRRAPIREAQSVHLGA